jgi:hypothetical protein
MDTTELPNNGTEALSAVAAAISTHIKTYPTPSDSCYGLSFPAQQPLLPCHEDSESSMSSHSRSSGRLSINANTETNDQIEVEEDDRYAVGIDDFPDKEYLFEDKLEYYAYYGEKVEHDPNEPEQTSEYKHHLSQSDYSETRTQIIAAATNIGSLLTPKERELLAMIKSRKDEAALGFPSPSHGYNPYLGPSCLRNATFERLGQFMNSSELGKIQVDHSDLNTSEKRGREEWRRRKARALTKTLYARAIREKETEAILKECEKQEKERGEMRQEKKWKIGVKSSLYAQYEIQPPEEEETVEVGALLKLELERKTEKLSPGERREWLRMVYGARWSWYAMTFGLHVVLEPEDALVRPEKAPRQATDS